MATMYNLVVFNLNNNLLTGKLDDFAFQTINNRQDLHSRLRYYDIGNNSFVGVQPGRLACNGDIHALSACCRSRSYTSAACKPGWSPGLEPLALRSLPTSPAPAAIQHSEKPAKYTCKVLLHAMR